MTSPEPLNKKLYEKIKNKIYEMYPKHSVYRSMMIVKKYKDAGGKYKENGSEKNTTKWLGQKWTSINDYYHDDKIVKCGTSDTEKKFDEYPLCRPLSIIKKLSKSQMKQLIDEKNKLKEKPLISSKLLKTNKFNIKDTITGSGDSYQLHNVIIKKKIPLEEAKQLAKDIIKDNKKKFYRETKLSYRFRNIPKTKFLVNSFRTKKVNENITLTFGKLKV